MVHGGGQLGHLGVEVPWERLVRFIVGQSAVLLGVQGVDGLLQEHETGPLLGRQEVHAVVALRGSECVNQMRPMRCLSVPLEQGSVVVWVCCHYVITKGELCLDEVSSAWAVVDVDGCV